MTTLDYFVLLVIGLSILLGMIRGFVRESLALAGWVGSFWAANFFSLKVSRLLPASIPGEQMRLLISFVLILVLSLIVTGLLARIVSSLVKSAGLGWADRLLGICFGLARGAVIVIAAAIVAGLTSLHEAAFWKEAKLRGVIETGAVMAKVWLPEDMASHVHFEKI